MLELGLGIRTGRTIGVHDVAAIELARKGGYAGAMTDRIAGDGAAASCDVAVFRPSATDLPAN